MQNLWSTNIYINSNAVLYACQFLIIQTFPSKYHHCRNFQRHCTDLLWRWESNWFLWPLNHSECQRAFSDNTPWTISLLRGARRHPLPYHVPHWEQASMRRKTERSSARTYVITLTYYHWTQNNTIKSFNINKDASKTFCIEWQLVPRDEYKKRSKRVKEASKWYSPRWCMVVAPSPIVIH